jgi:uncharacterized Zn finger protein (UPF0148 family)
VVVNPNTHEQLKKLKEENKQVQERKAEQLNDIKQKKVDKILEKAKTEEDIIIMKDKKLKAINKVISMTNNRKPREEIIKKIGNILDKYYIKEEELEI